MFDREALTRRAREGKKRREAWVLRASMWLVLLGVGAWFAGRSFHERADYTRTRCVERERSMKTMVLDGLTYRATCDVEARNAHASADRLASVGIVVLVLGVGLVSMALRQRRASRAADPDDETP